MSSPKTEREAVETRSSRIVSAEQHLQRAPVRWPEGDEYIDVRPYLQAVVEQRWKIAAITVTAALVTGLVATFVLPKWYRATAIIRPVSTPTIESRMAGRMGGEGGGLTQGLAAALGGPGDAGDAQEYIAILEAFQFSTGLARRHHIIDELLTPSWLRALLFGAKPEHPQWSAYRALQRRFDCEYSVKTGNITLYFQDKNRVNAEKILGYYIDDLRDVLRAREIRDTREAIDSLEAEASSTSDELLRTQLYDLAARQVERNKTAQVEADFAFRVLDPPFASYEPYRPSVALDTFLAAFLVGLLAGLWVMMRSATGRR